MRYGEETSASREKQHCGFRTGPTQTKLYRHRRWLDAGNFGLHMQIVGFPMRWFHYLFLGLRNRFRINTVVPRTTMPPPIYGPYRIQVSLIVSIVSW